MRSWYKGFVQDLVMTLASTCQLLLSVVLILICWSNKAGEGQEKLGFSGPNRHYILGAKISLQWDPSMDKDLSHPRTSSGCWPPLRCLDTRGPASPSCGAAKDAKQPGLQGALRLGPLRAVKVFSYIFVRPRSDGEQRSWSWQFLYIMVLREQLLFLHL